MTVFFSSLGQFNKYALLVLRRFFSRRYSLSAVTYQMHRIGVESLSVVNLCSFVIGLVFVVQIAAMMARFGAKAQVGMVVSASFVREIGPIFAAIMFAGRVGTGIAAEIGSMVVTEQIDAYRVFGADPVGKLAVPRVLAMALMLPALVAIADLVGIFSGFFLSLYSLGVPGKVYLNNALDILTTVDVISSVTKGLVFGLAIGLIATHAGFRTERAADAVGASATRTMVQCVIAILVLDLILTKFFLFVEA